MIWFISVVLFIRDNVTTCCGVHHNILSPDVNQSSVVQYMDGYDQCAQMDIGSFVLGGVIGGNVADVTNLVERLFLLRTLEVSRGEDGGCIVDNSPYNCLDDTVYSCVQKVNETYASIINEKIDIICDDGSETASLLKTVVIAIVSAAGAKILLLCLGIGCKYWRHELTSPQDEIFQSESDQPMFGEPEWVRKYLATKDFDMRTLSISTAIGVVRSVCSFLLFAIPCYFMHVRFVTTEKEDEKQYHYHLMDDRTSTLKKQTNNQSKHWPGHGNHKQKPVYPSSIIRCFVGFSSVCKYVLALLWWVLKHAYFSIVIVLNAILSISLALLKNTEVIGFLPCSSSNAYVSTCNVVRYQCWLQQWIILPGLSKINMPKLISTIIACTHLFYSFPFLLPWSGLIHLFAYFYVFFFFGKQYCTDKIHT
ncbi:hypothetical protein RFI_28609 [Reticulomyxa filosa]|uniref:Uncharacterized protein n=1 Tax=Reticulomyxa filosa TaxID=46433 RepID=X6M5N0_RETFI|nr:hypothetical protein RFI_28609 [Reticulomyxa filosa]|eukprot:ETO08777.1 hypothetical protein RFI_28609 [Reticulomyxa filosa]